MTKTLDPSGFTFELTTRSRDAVADATDLLEANGATITDHGGDRALGVYAIQVGPLETPRMRDLAEIICADARVSGVSIIAPVDADQNAFATMGDVSASMFPDVKAALTGTSLALH